MERVIRTLKALYFRFMASLSISKPETLASLAMNCYNARFHHSIQTTPIRAHFDGFCAGTVAETDKMKRYQHQLGAIDIELRKKRGQILRLGQKVKIKRKTNPFRKESLFSPAFSESVHTIEKIDQSTYPILYTISNSKNRYYAHQLLKLSDSYPNDHLLSKPKHRILIQDIIPDDSDSFTRSGKTKLGNNNLNNVKYITLRDGQIAHLTKEDLKLYKSLFGSQIFAYHSVFNQPEYQRHIV